MIMGVGIDAIEVPRMATAIKRNPTRLIKRIAHPIELRKAPSTKARQSEYWAARFAAKEAFAKALGTGIGRVVTWRSVGVAKKKEGRPYLVYSAALKKALAKRGISRAHLAITHTSAAAVVVVILEGSNQ